GAIQAGRFVGKDLGYAQISWPKCRIAVAGSGDRRLQEFGDRLGCNARRGAHQRNRLSHGAVTERVDHGATLARRDRELGVVDSNLHRGCAAAVAPSAAALPPCRRNLRVGENSPSLWPTMSSITWTRMKSLPLCTSKIRPTISGVIVDERAQVRIGLVLRRSAFSTFFWRLGSTNGPFLSDRLILLLSPCAVSV